VTPSVPACETCQMGEFSGLSMAGPVFLPRPSGERVGVRGKLAPHNDLGQRARRPRRVACALAVNCPSAPTPLHHNDGWHATVWATANWLQRPDTATRHACELPWRAKDVQIHTPQSELWYG
jgi:hypothetical protein